MSAIIEGVNTPPTLHLSLSPSLSLPSSFSYSFSSSFSPLSTSTTPRLHLPLFLLFFLFISPPSLPSSFFYSYSSSLSLSIFTLFFLSPSLSPILPLHLSPSLHFASFCPTAHCSSHTHLLSSILSVIYSLFSSLSLSPSLSLYPSLSLSLIINHLGQMPLCITVLTDFPLYIFASSSTVPVHIYTIHYNTLFSLEMRDTEVSLI